MSGSWIGKLFGSCCQAREANSKLYSSEYDDLSKGFNKLDCSDKMKNYSLSTQSCNINETVDSEHEITVSRSERVEKLVMSRKMDPKDSLEVPMTTSRRIRYNRSTSDADNKSIVIDNPSFCENIEFRRGDEKEENPLQVKNFNKPKRQIKMWTPEEDEMLKKFYELMGNKWDDIAKKIPVRKKFFPLL